MKHSVWAICTLGLSLIGTPGAGGQHNASGNNTVWLYAVLAF